MTKKEKKKNQLPCPCQYFMYGQEQTVWNGFLFLKKAVEAEEKSGLGGEEPNPNPNPKF